MTIHGCSSYILGLIISRCELARYIHGSTHDDPRCLRLIRGLTPLHPRMSLLHPRITRRTSTESRATSEDVRYDEDRGERSRDRSPAACFSVILIVEPRFERREVVQHRRRIHLPRAGDGFERFRPRAALAHRQHFVQAFARLFVAVDGAAVERAFLAGRVAQCAVELELEDARFAILFFVCEVSD